MIEEYEIIDSAAKAWTNKLLGLYFFQFVTLIILIAAIATGRLKMFFDWILSFRKVKVGKVELEGGELKDERRHHKRRQQDKQPVCAVAECPRYTELAESVEKIAEHVDEIWTAKLRSDFYNAHLPVPERLLSGLKYVWWIELNGLKNGSTKEHVIAMGWKNYDLYKMATVQDPRLKIDELEKKGQIDSILELK